MSLSATLFGRDSFIFKVTNVLGLGIPGLLDKTFGPGEQPGMALGEIAQQTAKEGEPRVIVWGRVRPIGGNLIHVQRPVKRWVKQKSSGGKGGGGSKKTQKVEHVYRTYAVGVCEGPITGYARIWRNNKLVYDGRGTAWGRANNRVFLRSFRLYLGGWNQMPDPALEAIWGAGNVPAYRGTAYMVSLDEDLTDLGGSVPQWLFEVERAEGLVLTSGLYAVESEDAVQPTFDFEAATLRQLVKKAGAGQDAIQPSLAFGSAALKEPIVYFNPKDAVQPAIGFELAALREPIIRAGSAEAVQPSIDFGVTTVRKALIVNVMEPESVQPGITFEEAQLYDPN